MPRQAKSTSAAFTVSAPPSSLSFASDHTAVSVPCCVSGATSCAGNSSSAFASGPEHGVSRSSTSVAPASLVDQNSQNELFRGFLAFMRNQEVVSTAASSLASAQSDTDTRLVYTSAPSDRPFSRRRYYTSRSSNPAGSGKRLRGWGGGGMGAAGAPTHQRLVLVCPSSSSLRWSFSQPGGRQILGCSSFLGRFRWSSTYGGRGSIVLRPSLW